jgi:hypothetical protein
MEVPVDPDARQPEYFRCLEQRRATALATALVGLLFGVQAAGCGGGSSGMPGGGGPPPQAFTTIDAVGAGAGSEQGTFGGAVNLTGNVAGYFSDPSGLIHGFIRNAAGAITTVDAPGDGNLGTRIVAIDAAGDTVGAYFDSQEGEHSFIRTADGTITTFDPSNNTTSGAQSINDGGTVAGGFRDANGSHGYLRSPGGTFTTFDPTGSGTEIEIVIPFRINASGAVAGTYVDDSGVLHGFLRDPNGNVTILDAPGAGTAANTGTELLDMNASGMIAGGIQVGVVNGINTSHSLVRAADGTYTVFDPPQSGAHSSLAEAINDSGAIVGTYRDANLVRHGYLRQPDGTFVSFDDPDAAQVPLTATNQGTVPRSINPNGAVAGYYSDVNGVRHGFIWQ